MKVFPPSEELNSGSQERRDRGETSWVRQGLLCLQMSNPEVRVGGWLWHLSLCCSLESILLEWLAVMWISPYFSSTLLMFLPKWQTCLKRTVFPEATTVLRSRVPWVKWVVQTIKAMPLLRMVKSLWEEAQLGATLLDPGEGGTGSES